MKHQLTIDRFEGDKAVLKTKDGETIIWPKNKLPENINEGTVLTYLITGDIETEQEKQEIAKEILNEILNTN